MAEPRGKVMQAGNHVKQSMLIRTVLKSLHAREKLNTEHKTDDERNNDEQNRVGLNRSVDEGRAINERWLRVL
jgi:hypothetical protein